MSAARDRRSLQPPERSGSPSTPKADPVDAFISHADEDADAADRLRAVLVERDQAVWIDAESVVAGADRQAAITRAIEACTAFVFLISPDSVGSAVCRRQLDQAAAQGRLIVPVLLRAVEHERLPPAIAARHWVSLRDTDDFDAGVARLIAALQNDPAWLDGYTRLVGRTREWLDGGRDRSFLLRGGDLRDAEGWLAQQGNHLQTPSAEHAEYIAASRRAATARQRALLGGVLGTLLVSTALAGFALVQRDRAVQERTVAISRSVAAQAVLIVDRDPALAAALSLEAYRVQPSAEARDALRGVLPRLGPGIGAMTGHTGRLNSVAVSPDGKTVASAGDDKTLRLWALDTRAGIGRPLTGHANAVRAVAFSPGGETLASAGLDGTARLWDVATRRPSGKPIKSDKLAFNGLAFSPDGKTLATAGGDKTVRLWDVATRRPIGRPLHGHGAVVRAVAFSPDGKTLASAGGDKTVRLWDVATRAAIGSPLEAHSDILSTIAFSPDGRTLATASRDETLQLWDVATRRPAGEPIGGPDWRGVSWLLGMAFSPDGRTVATASNDLTVRLWSVATGRQTGPPVVPASGGASHIAFTPDGKSIVSANSDYTVRVWNIATDAGQAPAVKHLPRMPPYAIAQAANDAAFSTDGRLRASAGVDHVVRLWNVDANTPIGPPLTGHSGVVWGVAFSPGAKILASGGDDGTVRLWSLETHRQLGAPLTGHRARVQGVAFSPDRKTLASAGDETVHLWDVATHREIGVLKGHTSAIPDVAFSPDGRTLATASTDGTARLWDVATRRLRGAPLTGHKDIVWAVAFSPDSKMLATTGSDGAVRLWSVANGRPVGRALRGHSGAVLSVAFSPDGKTLASAGFDQTTRLWDVASGAALGAPIASQHVSVLGVGFSRDGKRLASADNGDAESLSDSILWSRSLEAQQARLCAAARRNLSRAEWSTYLPGARYRQTCP